MKHKQTKLQKKLSKNTLLVIAASIIAVLLVWAALNWTIDTFFNAKINSPPATKTKSSTTSEPSSQSVPQTPKQAPMPVSQWPVTLSNDQAASLTVVVNKKHRLPADYAPALITTGLSGGGQMRSEAAAALKDLFAAANNSGIALSVVSAYRSYAQQQQTYQGYVARDGQTAADTYSARPGHSEHQTGLAVDVGNADGSCSLDICFGDTSAGKWIAANSAKYGFIIRYPSGKEAETGYQYEPWHLRFLGTDLAQKVYSSGETYDKYTNTPAGNY